MRFHKPDKFGDDLNDVRASVRYVNQHKKPTFGFEEGRIFNGYRFVYPLSDEQGKHLGSVEVSMSLLAFKEAFETDAKHIDFLLSKSTIQNKVFKDQQSNYQVSALSDVFYIQKTLEAFNLNDPHAHAAAQKKIYQVLANDQSLIAKLNALEPLVSIKWLGLTPYSVKFMPLLNDFTQKTVGYTVIFSKSNYFSVYWVFHSAVSLGIIVLSMLFALALFFNKNARIARSKTEQLERLNKKINDINHLLDSIINGTDDKIFYKDKHSTYLGCNESFAKGFNLTPAALVGKTDFDLFPEKIAEGFRKDDSNVLKSNKPNSLYEEVTFPYADKGYFLTQKIPFIYDDKQDVGLLGIARDITELHEAQIKLEALSYTDDLTGLFNRKAYNKNLTKAFATLSRYQTPFSMIMLDIDDFKKINDTYGHDVGDKVLVLIAETLTLQVRENDFFFELGEKSLLFYCPAPA